MGSGIFLSVELDGDLLCNGEKQHASFSVFFFNANCKLQFARY